MLATMQASPHKAANQAVLDHTRHGDTHIHTLECSVKGEIPPSGSGAGKHLIPSCWASPPLGVCVCVCVCVCVYQCQANGPRQPGSEPVHSAGVLCVTHPGLTVLDPTSHQKHKLALLSCRGSIH